MKLKVEASRKAPESTFHKIVTWPLRMARKAATLLSIHTTSWFIGLTSSWGETSYIALAQAGMANPYVRRAYDLITDNLSSVSIFAQRGTGDDAKKVDNHPFLTILKRPNPETGYQGFIAKIIAHLMFGGELFFYAPETPLTGPNAGIPQKGGKLELIRPDRVLEFIYDAEDNLVAYRVAPRTHNRLRGLGRSTGLERIIPAPRIKHIRLYCPYDEDFGLPMLISAWRQVQLMEDGDSWNKSVAQNRGRTPGFFKYKGEGVMDDDQYARTKESMQEAYAKDSKEGRPGLLDGDFDFVPAATSQKDADWLLSDAANGRKVAIALGVDPSLLGDQGSRTLANLNEGLRHLLLLRVLPVLDWLLDEWNHHYMPAYGDERLTYSRQEIAALEEDWNAKVDRLATAIESTIMTPNEARKELRLNPIPGRPELDVLWKPVSRDPIGIESAEEGSETGEMETLARMSDEQFKDFAESHLPKMLEALAVSTTNGKH